MLPPPAAISTPENCIPSGRRYNGDMENFSPSLARGKVKSWYHTEQNTGYLIRTIFGCIDRDDLSSEAIWHLLTLTWITVHDGEATGSHWKKYKVPALAFLFRTRAPVLRVTLSATLEQMALPENVRLAADCDTGMINYRDVWRNSSEPWCHRNVIMLRKLLNRAYGLSSNDQGRFELAADVAKLKGVPSPSGKVTAGADNTLTPLLACLDPKGRFPIVNAREGVKRLLRSRGLADQSLQVQVKGLVGLIGQWGIPDAFALDVLADEIARKRRTPRKGSEAPSTGVGVGLGVSQLPRFDVAERIAITKSRTAIYRKRHNEMTNALRQIFGEEKLKRGMNRNCLFDVLFKNYDNNGRDLLIEVKPDPDKGSVRIAIGQLFDYRRLLLNRAATDLALLTITRPPKMYSELLLDLQITALWFTDEACTKLMGVGKAYTGLGLPADTKKRLSP
jgi:hypothetical protein